MEVGLCRVREKKEATYPAKGGGQSYLGGGGGQGVRLIGVPVGEERVPCCFVKLVGVTMVMRIKFLSLVSLIKLSGDIVPVEFGGFFNPIVFRATSPAF